MDITNNPFAQLFPSLNDAQEYVEATKGYVEEAGLSTSQQEQLVNMDASQDSSPNKLDKLQRQLVNDFLQRTFLVTVNPDPDYHGNVKHGGLPARCVFTRDLHSELKETNDDLLLSMDNINQALMERLQMQEPNNHMSIQGGRRESQMTAEQTARSNKTLDYLYQSCKRCRQERNRIQHDMKKEPQLLGHLTQVSTEFEDLIYEYSKSVLLSPELFTTLDPSKQLHTISMASSHDEYSLDFLRGLLARTSDSEELHTIFSKLLDHIYEDMKDLKLMSTTYPSILETLTYYSTDQRLSAIFTSHNKWLVPDNEHDLPYNTPGHMLETNTFLGRLLGASCVGRSAESDPEDFFNNQSNRMDSEMRSMTDQIRARLDYTVDKLHEILKNCMSSDKGNMNRILSYVGIVLFANRKREKMMFNPESVCSAGFILNLNQILLKFCQPFMSPKSPILHKVDCRYGNVKVIREDLLDRTQDYRPQAHIIDQDSHDKMVPSIERCDDNIPLPSTVAPTDRQTVFQWLQQVRNNHPSTDDRFQRRIHKTILNRRIQCIHNNKVHRVAAIDWPPDDRWNHMVTPVTGGVLVEDYYKNNFGLTITDRAQPVLGVQTGTGNDVDLLVPEFCWMIPEGDYPHSELQPSEDVQFKFATHLFYLTHLSLKQGWMSVADEYSKLMHQLNKMSETYQQLLAQGPANDAVDQFKSKFEKGIRRQIALKSHLLNRSLTDLLVGFSVASSSWLVQRFMPSKAMCLEGKPVQLNLDLLSDEVVPALSIIPEMICENIGDTMRMLGSFQSECLEEADDDLLRHVMEFFAVTLGSKSRLHNPHTRAKLAECLAYFIPQEKSNLALNNGLKLEFRKMAFQRSAVVAQLLPRSLLQLFVDIEFTGDSMEFYQKFNYRHWMYTILEYIWKIPSYLESFKQMYEEGREAYRSSMIFTTFPRFITLLVNDTNHMLDEALSNLKTIREVEQEKSRTEYWASLTEDEKERKESQLKESAAHAKQYNIMARETLHVISYVTKDLTSPFASPCMLEGMANFLNYFLSILAGKERAKLKVTDFSRFNFNPHELLKLIVQTYLQLGKHEDFRKALAMDERSYSDELFTMAIDLLNNIHQDLVPDFSALAKQLAEWKVKLTQETKLPEPPEAFLDPISCSIMLDPVRLPSSNQVCDKSTISRHLLSDETDPFNRSPLRLENVIELPDLKQQIVEWMRENGMKVTEFGSNEQSEQNNE